MNYSVTQGSNLASIAGAVVILARLLGYDLPMDDVVTVIAAVAIVIAPIVSYVNRHMKGDVTPLGFKK